MSSRFLPSLVMRRLELDEAHRLDVVPTIGLLLEAGGFAATAWPTAIDRQGRPRIGEGPEPDVADVDGARGLVRSDARALRSRLGIDAAAILRTPYLVSAKSSEPSQFRLARRLVLDTDAHERAGVGPVQS